MADQIALRVQESQVSAGSAVSVTANFRTRATGAASTPSSIRYRVDCLTNKANVVNWTSVAAANSATITVGGTLNAIIDIDSDYETRQLLVELDTGLSTQARHAIQWKVRNVHTYAPTVSFPDDLLLEPNYPLDALEASLTIEHFQYPPGHRFRYLDTFDVLDAHYYRRTPAEIAAGVTPVSYQYEPGDARRNGYVADGTFGADSGTDNATALANCIATNVITDLPEGVGLFSGTITLPVGKTIRGKGPRKTTLKQISTATVAGITLGDVVSTDISEGAHRVVDLCLSVAAHASAHGIQIGDGATAVNASMLDFSNLRIWSQQQETHTTSPVAVIANQRGIYINSASSAVFVANLRNVEIRAFDIGIDASGTPLSANEWSVRGWFLDCRIGVRLSNASTWDLSGLSIESGCEDARALYTLNSVSNINWHGGRWELPQADSYGVEGDATTVGANWRFSGITVLIAGDGSAIPGRKWTGTVPNDFIFGGYTATAPFLVVPNVATSLRLPSSLLLGGQNLGNASISLDRDLGGSICTVSVGADGILVINGFNGAKVQVNGVTTLELDDSAVAANTRMKLYDQDNAALERVTVGVADSGGVGFKVLRIPN